MKHEFIMLDKEEIPYIATYDLKGENKVVFLDDYVVANNPLFFHGFKTYKVSFKNESEGLDYHGNTIIPTESISSFLENILKVRWGNLEPMMETRYIISKDMIKKQLDDLIIFCKIAINKKKYIIHFGI